MAVHDDKRLHGTGAVLTETAAQPVAASRFPRYVVRAGRLCRIDIDKSGHERTTRLTTFTARIIQEIKRQPGREDGEIAVQYVVEGEFPDGTRLPPLTVDAQKFRRMEWLAPWGYQAAVKPNLYEHAQMAIRDLSKNVEQILSYPYVGWAKVNGQPVYITSQACIGANGPVAGVRCDTDRNIDVRLFELPPPVTGEAERVAVHHSLDLLNVAQPHLAFVLLGATYRSVLGQSRFVVTVTGTTGYGKTSYCSIIQSHFGRQFHPNQLAASWQSTGYGLLEIADAARDCVLLADDLKASGTDAKRIFDEFDKLVNAAAESTGRSRLQSNGEPGPKGGYPRGTVLVTSEITPPGHSNNARLVQVELNSSLLETEEQRTQMSIWESRASKGIYAQAMANFVRWVAQHHDRLYGDVCRRAARRKLRSLFSGDHNHARHPDNVADLAAGWQTYLEYAVECQALTPRQANQLWERAVHILRQVAAQQAQRMQTVDPALTALTLLDSALRLGQAHLIDAQTGNAPVDSERWGWRVTPDQNIIVMPGSQKIGYLQSGADRHLLLLDPGATYALLADLARKRGLSLPPAPDLWRRMREKLAPDGHMLYESGKNTHRRAVHGSGKNRVALLNIADSYSTLLDERDHLDIPPLLGVSDVESADGQMELVELERV